MNFTVRPALPPEADRLYTEAMARQQHNALLEFNALARNLPQPPLASAIMVQLVVGAVQQASVCDLTNGADGNHRTYYISSLQQNPVDYKSLKDTVPCFIMQKDVQQTQIQITINDKPACTPLYVVTDREFTIQHTIDDRGQDALVRLTGVQEAALRDGTTQMNKLAVPRYLNGFEVVVSPIQVRCEMAQIAASSCPASQALTKLDGSDLRIEARFGTALCQNTLYLFYSYQAPRAAIQDSRKLLNQVAFTRALKRFRYAAFLRGFVEKPEELFKKQLLRSKYILGERQLFNQMHATSQEYTQLNRMLNGQCETLLDAILINQKEK